MGHSRPFHHLLFLHFWLFSISLNTNTILSRRAVKATAEKMHTDEVFHWSITSKDATVTINANFLVHGASNSNDGDQSFM